MTYQRIMVIGCCGAGKSTLARALGERTGIEVIHLDAHYWQPDWTETAPEPWREIVRELAAGDRWIIDGNYGGTMDLRLARADLVIYLDYPTMNCLWRVLRRTHHYHGSPRPDMPDGCPERYDLEFLHYVATFNLTRRKFLLRKLEPLRTQKRVVILRNDREVTDFLENPGHKW